jgi:hypothetical protein
MSSYGSLPLRQVPVVDPQETVLNHSRSNKRLIIGTLACLTVLVSLTVGLHRHRDPTVLCDEATCMMNSPPKPPGIIETPSAPRVLSPAEMKEMKDALEEEEVLEKQVALVLL